MPRKSPWVILETLAMRKGRTAVALIPVFLMAALAAPVFLPTALHPPARASAGDDPRFDRLAAFVGEKMKVYGVPGVSLGVFERGKITTRGFGVCSIDNPLPVTDQTLFQLGSISKTYTGTLIMKLIDSGKLRLDAPVRTYIPDFRVQDERASNEATILTLLTHMGGWEGDYFDDTGGGDDALRKAVAGMSRLEQIAPFNTVWSYNNAGYYVAGRIIEVVTGKTYEQALKDLLLDPLDLRRTFVFPADVMTLRFVVGHGGSIERPNVTRPWPLARAAHAVGGITASIKDLLWYGQFHLGDGTVPAGTRILSEASLKKMHETQAKKNGTDDEMAVTWHITNDGGMRQSSHGGSTVGQRALLTLVHSRQFAIGLLTNSERGAQLNRDVTRAALREYLGVSIADPKPMVGVESELPSYVGNYSRPYSDVIVRLDGGRLLIQSIQKQGFPTPTTPIPPPQAPVPFAMYARDRLVATEGPQAGARAEIIRRTDGSVGWIRLGLRVARRVDGASAGGVR